MRIESDQDLMKACLATMMACEMEESIKEGLIQLYSEIAVPLEGKHGLEPSVEDIQKEVMTHFNEVLESFPVERPEGFDLEELSKAFAGWLFCHRMVEVVEDLSGHLEAMASIHSFFNDLQNQAFREKNR